MYTHDFSHAHTLTHPGPDGVVVAVEGVPSADPRKHTIQSWEWGEQDRALAKQLANSKRKELEMLHLQMQQQQREAYDAAHPRANLLDRIGSFSWQTETRVQVQTQASSESSSWVAATIRGSSHDAQAESFSAFAHQQQQWQQQQEQQDQEDQEEEQEEGELAVPRRRLLDTFGDSLRHVNKLYTDTWGSEQRKVCGVWMCLAFLDRALQR